MRTHPLCIPCVLYQVQRMAEKIRREDMLEEITKGALKVIKDLSLDDPPNIYTTYPILEAYRILKTDDPYKEEKREESRIVGEFIPKIEDRLKLSDDPLFLSLLYAAMGNSVDVGAQSRGFDLKKELERAEEKGFAHNDYEILKERLNNARSILYILDNTGEVYFDRLVLEYLKGFRIKVVVKSAPILNDVCEQEAKEVGLDRIAEIIPTGSRFLGIDFRSISEELREALKSSDVVIAKGHANFESLVDRDRDCFFLLKAKCRIVAEKLGVGVGDFALYYYNPRGV